MIEDNEARVLQALKRDLNRHDLESTFTDIYTLKLEIMDFLKNLKRWTSTEKVDAGFILGFLGKARLRKDPLGVSLIIGAWNFPFVLLLQPLIAAIAAGLCISIASSRYKIQASVLSNQELGCCVMLKPSELAVQSGLLLQDLVPKYLDPLAIRIVTAGPTEMSYILEKHFNQIFFTGSSTVARFIAAAAAKHLTPTVLELGGQGPCVVTKSANIDLAARRITHSKFINAGQICLSVNHVFAEPEIMDQLVDRMAYWNDQYLSQGNSDMCRIVNERNFSRLARLLEETKGQTVYGGDWNRNEKFIHPTIVKDITLDDTLMSEELFGPILPVIPASVDEAIDSINAGPEPLAIYIFAQNDTVVEKIMNRTISGGVTINNVFFHANLNGAPFGGVGESGYGSYHGKHGIDCFSHSRPVVSPPAWFDNLLGFSYPPYDAKNRKYLTVKNSLYFQRGETLEYQRRVASKGNHVSVLSAIGLAVILGLYYFCSSSRLQLTSLFGCSRV